MADEKDPRRDPSTQNSSEVDPETRMLEQIAALDGDAPAPKATTDDEQNAAAAKNTVAETEDHPEPAVERTAPKSPIAAEHETKTFTGASHPTKRRRWPWVTLPVVIIALAAGYVGLAFATQDTLPATLTVEGVDVSGMSVEDAAPVLEEALAARAEREVTVAVEHADDVEAAIVPAESGYSYDVDATLDELTDLTFNPVALWSRLFGQAHVSAETSVDEAAVSEAIAGLDEQLSFEPTEGAVVFEGAELHYTQPVNGFAMDEEALAEQLEAQWLSETDRITASGEVQDPAVSSEEWDQFVTETAQPLIEDDYTVTAGDITTQLTPAQLGSAAEVRVEGASEAAEEAAADDEATEEDESTVEDTTTDASPDPAEGPMLVLDGEALTEALEQNNPEFASTNQDATVRLSGSAGSAEPEVVPGSSGRGVDGEEVVDEILADLSGEQSRTISVELQEVEPEVTTEDAEAWDVNHVEAEYSTPYPPEDTTRTKNLQVGANRVNGTVVMPGEEFNLNSILAPVTEANGYYQSGVVESGVTTTAVGGGLSQIATMAYNAGFLGGMEIVEHKPHSRWFDRYPKGRESTYWEGQINVRWENDTDAPVIVEMWLADSKVHTRLWGSDYYDVSTTTSEPYNYTDSPTIRSSDQECVSESGGREGFTVDIDRTKTPPDGEAVEESWSWAYSGWPTVICENN